MAELNKFAESVELSVKSIEKKEKLVDLSDTI